MPKGSHFIIRHSEFCLLSSHPPSKARFPPLRWLAPPPVGWASSFHTPVPRALCGTGFQPVFVAWASPPMFALRSTQRHPNANNAPPCHCEESLGNDAAISLPPLRPHFIIPCSILAIRHSLSSIVPRAPSALVLLCSYALLPLCPFFLLGFPPSASYNLP